MLPVVERQSPDHWTPWKKNHDQPGQHIEKQKHYFANKVCLVKALFFPVVMYGCEKRTIKKAEHQENDAFKLQCWRRFLRVLGPKGGPTVNPKGNQS